MRSGRAEKEYSFGAISWQAYSSEGRADLPVGMHADGAEHYLQVTGAGAKSWVYRYSSRGKARKMGAGLASAVGLADARIKAGECRTLRQGGIDPIQARDARRPRAALDAAKRWQSFELVAAW